VFRSSALTARSIKRTFRGRIPHLSACEPLTCHVDGRIGYLVAVRESGLERETLGAVRNGDPRDSGAPQSFGDVLNLTEARARQAHSDQRFFDGALPPAMPLSTKRSTKKIDAWRTWTLSQAYPYVYLDATSLKRSWDGEVCNVSILVAIAVAAEGFREVIGTMEGAKEDKESRSDFVKHLFEAGVEESPSYNTAVSLRG
jgi:hypothetical protein